MNRRQERIAQGCSWCKSPLRNDGFCPNCDEWDVCARCHYEAFDASPLCENHTNQELFPELEDEMQDQYKL